MRNLFTPTLISKATAYADQSDDTNDEFVIPEELSSLNDTDLGALHDRAVEHFDSLYGDGSDLTDEDMQALAGLTEGIEALSAEVATRDAASEERATAAAELAARIRPADESAVEESEEEFADETEATAETLAVEDEEAASEEEAAEEVVASARGPIRVPLANVRSRGRTHRPAPVVADNTPAGIKDVMVASGEGLGVAVNTGLDWPMAGAALDRRLGTYNRQSYARAAQQGQQMREQGALLSIKRDIPEDLTVRSNDPDHVEQIFQRAMDETRLPGGSLVAAGGWCAPSEVTYEMIEMESRDGLLSIPEIGIPRGGISFTPGPTFASIFEDIAGFSFTEDQGIAGEYKPNDTPGEPNVVGPKPCYTVPCPNFEEHRLDVDGLCIQSGLLQQKGYPEVLARTLRGALIAHDHRLNGSMIAQMAAGSDAVTMTASTVGVLAPTLDAIEKQVEHYRYIHRMTRSTTLEAVFPFWIRGAIRSDLALRQGVDMIDVPDARVDAWFRSRGVNPQYVYNWQPIGGDANAFLTYPATVKFLLYSAGTWIRGASDIITVDTLYDSALLAQNDFTALFTEEGWFVAQRGHDSRVVTAAICPSGATNIGVDIACNGTAVPDARADSPLGTEEDPFFTGTPA